MKTYLTSDTHFRHKNIIKYCKRPFASIEEHDEALIANWNSVVRKEDQVYHLGDFGFGSTSSLLEIRKKLNGKIYLIRGNHDKSIKKEILPYFEWVKDVHFLTVQEEGETYKIFLSHYSHRAWDRSFRGSWHCFGHSHGNLPEYELSFDVGVDCWNYYPVNLKQIKEKMNSIIYASEI